MTPDRMKQIINAAIQKTILDIRKGQVDLESMVDSTAKTKFRRIDEAKVSEMARQYIASEISGENLRKVDDKAAAIQFIAALRKDRLGAQPVERLTRSRDADSVSKDDGGGNIEKLDPVSAIKKVHSLNRRVGTAEFVEKRRR